MTLSVFALALSCAPGGEMTFRVGGGPGSVTVFEVPTGRVVHTGSVSGSIWTLAIPGHWPSSLYRAVFSSRPDGAPDGPDADVHFVVRAGRTAASILVSVPFTTWQAYHRAGQPGEGLYYAEQPARATHVTFDRPGAGRHRSAGNTG